ncbi:hypothetical protein ABE485_13745 [Achromobacter spanius]|uniref:hypothetical protein n=1 Tax=Achromobacter spanius TaxID=217203 RepID=UPI003209DBD5
MDKIDWNPYAAKAVLGLASADQRRVVDAVWDFRWRMEHETGWRSAAVQHSITAGAYVITFRVLDRAVQVQDVKLGGDLR